MNGFQLLKSVLYVHVAISEIGVDERHRPSVWFKELHVSGVTFWYANFL